MRFPRLVIAMLTPALLGAQGTGVAALAGTVRDTLGHPLRQVIVTVDSTTLTAMSDDSGRFHIKGIAPGKNGFALRRIGYSPVDFETTLDSGRTLVIDIRMKALQTLNRVTVTGERSARLEQTGFFSRKIMGLGTFVTPERVDSLAPMVTSAAALLRDLKGVDLKCGPGRCVVRARNGPSCLNVFVNGGFREGQLDDNVALSEVYAIEFYERPVLVPSEFQGKMASKGGRAFSTRAGCGAIAVWTRGRSAP